MSQKYNVLIMGARYGSLFGIKLLLAGHTVRMTCRPEAARLINAEGCIVRMPVKGRDGLLEIRSADLPTRLSAATPDKVDASDFDLVVLAMQEPQYRFPEVSGLLQSAAKNAVPCLSIMNMPPPPYLARIPAIDEKALHGCYTAPEVWRDFDPALMTLASPDPQAFRPPDAPANVLQVSLPTNFKTARFDSDAHTAMLQQMQTDIEAIQFDAGDAKVELPVKLKVHESLFVPLAKWPMLLTGNYRCIGDDDMRAMREAVHADLDASRAMFEWVCALCEKLGADKNDLVPFDKYAAAANGLTKPSSAARALFEGAHYIERVDCIIKTLAMQLNLPHSPALDTVQQIVARVNARLEKNRATPQD